MKILSILLSLLLAACPVFGGVDFDATDDYIDCGADSSLDITSNLSISAWVYLDDISDNISMEIIGKRTSSSTGGYVIQVYEPLNGGIAPLLRFWIYASGGWRGEGSPNCSISLDTWTQVGTTYDGTTMRYYKNGQECDTYSYSGAITSISTDKVYIGANEANSKGYFDGMIENVLIWDATLQADEMSLLYNSKLKHMPLQIQPSNLVLFLPLDDEPDGTSGDGDTFIDLSGNGNDGTGDDGANNTGLTAVAEKVLSYTP